MKNDAIVENTKFCEIDCNKAEAEAAACLLSSESSRVTGRANEKGESLFVRASGERIN